MKEIEGRKAFTDELGCLWISTEDEYYFDQRPGESHPLTGPITVEDLKNYSWPNPRDPARVKT